MTHFLHKLASTLRITGKLALARMFGRYEHSVHAAGLDYAVYHWRGEVWAFPTQPLDEH